MIRLLLALLITSACGIAFSQTALDEVKRQVYGNPFGAANENWINMTNSMFDDNSVSLLLLDNWKPLEVQGTKGELILIDSANYHIESDKILFVFKNAMFELYPEKTEEAILDSRKFVSMPFEQDKQLRTGYFEVLIEGEVSLYQRWELNRKVTNSSPLGLPAAREEKYELDERLFYRRNSSTRMVRVPSKKTDFVKIFRRDRYEMVDYAKRNRLNPRRTEDVVAMIDYYNGLEQ